MDVASLQSDSLLFVQGPGMDANSGWSTTFVAVDDDSDGSPRVATYRMFVPGGSWDAADNGTYTVRLSPYYRLRDASGNSATWIGDDFFPAIGTFTVSVASDSTPPTVVSVLPPDSSSPSSGPSEIVFQFSEPMDQLSYISGLSTLSPSHLGLGGPGVGSAYATSASWVGEETIRFTMDGTWGTGQVLFWIAGYPRDLAGNLAEIGMNAFTK